MADNQLSESDIHDHIPKHASGLSIPFAAFFIVGEIAGTGVLALPKAVDDSGWIGLVLIVACALLSSYTGSILGQAWLIVRERYPEYQRHCPNPYRYVVSFSINFTMFGVAVVFLLLAAENIEDLIEDWTDIDLSFCIWLVILAACICPLTWLGTPVDFWPVAVGATLATAVACILLIIKVALDVGTYDPILHSKTEFEPFFMAFGTIAFAFGGHPAYPTFQTDMKKPKNFKCAVLLAYIITIPMYLPMPTIAYFVYGKNVRPNILLMPNGGTLNQVVEVMITIHLLLGLLICINPFCQDVGLYARVPEDFTWKRCVFRSLIVATVLFVAETIPTFGNILSLVGGSTVTLLAFICPSLFYLKLKSLHQKDMAEILERSKDDNFSILDKENRGLPLWVKVMNIEIILLGAVAGVASTYSAIKSIISSDFSKPCYL